MSKARQANLAKIHIAKKELGMDDDAYRAMLMDVAHVESASKLDFHGQHAVLHRMKELGWKPKSTKNKGRKSGKKKTQADKIRACWITMHQQGIVHDAGETALSRYIKRMTHGKKQRPEFLDIQEASMIIESLKRWANDHGVIL